MKSQQIWRAIERVAESTRRTDTCELSRTACQAIMKERKELLSLITKMTLEIEEHVRGP
jgi:hypothetical protein